MADPMDGQARLLGRLGGPPSAAVAAFVAGLVGAAGLAASVLADWHRVRIFTPSANASSSRIFEEEVVIGLESMPYGSVYLIGVLGLLGILGTVVSRPDRAAWLRLTATGLGLGVVAVVLATMFSVESAVRTQYFGQPIVGGSAEPLAGGFLALGGVAALVAGVWLAARRIERAMPGAVGAVGAVPAAPQYVLVPAVAVAGTATTAPAGPAGDGGFAAVPTPFPAAPPAPAAPSSAPPSPPSPAPASPPPVAEPPGRVGYLDGLTVTTSEPIDAGAGSDVLRM